MTLIDRYHSGETTQVYTAIMSLGTAALQPPHLDDVQAVLTETMYRVAYNLEVLYKALQNIGYGFHQHPRHDFEHPLLKPTIDADGRIQTLAKLAEPFGYIPLSLTTFWKIVGSCNFAWDYERDPNISWGEADPIQIHPVTDIGKEAEKDLAVLQSGDEPAGIWVAADYYHKDNISGGQPYSVELTATPQIDSRFLHEGHQTTFINYLRICMDGCGFSRAATVASRADFDAYCSRVRPLLRRI